MVMFFVPGFASFLVLLMVKGFMHSSRLVSASFILLCTHTFCNYLCYHG